MTTAILKSNNVTITEITPDNAAKYGFCSYKNVAKHTELQRKIEWFNSYYQKGLRCKMIVTENDESQGMIEYIPGEYAHRPVHAEGYLFIHCIFVGFKKEFKGKGYASALIDACIQDSRDQDKNGVAVVTRKSSFMADKDIFLKKNFVVVEKAAPDFELLALKFNKKTKDPTFKIQSTEEFQNGLTLIRSAQCPYSVKNVEAIIESAQQMKIKTQLIELEDLHDLQSSPCAFGTFCIIYNGEVISYHPISNTRFMNIMKKKLAV